MKEFGVRILHNRPEYPGVEFLEYTCLKTERNEEYVENIMRKAFTKAHPSWTILKITVSET